MHKILSLILIPVFILTSCTNDIDTSSATERKKIKEMSPEIIRCFVEKDKEALTNLFCERIRNNPDFSIEIDKAFQYFKCDFYWGTRTISDSAGGGKAKDEGKVTHWYVTPQMDYVATYVYINDNFETKVYVYNMNYMWMIYNQDKAIEGLHNITIELINVDNYTLGENFEWYNIGNIN